MGAELAGREESKYASPNVMGYVESKCKRVIGEAHKALIFGGMDMLFVR